MQAEPEEPEVEVEFFDLYTVIAIFKSHQWHRLEQARGESRVAYAMMKLVVAATSPRDVELKVQAWFDQQKTSPTAATQFSLGPYGVDAVPESLQLLRLHITRNPGDVVMV